MAAQALPDQVDVLVVGAGPAGFAMSLLLARWGIGSLLVDARTSPSTLPRARGVHARAMEILRVAGVEPAMRAEELTVTPGIAVHPRLVDPPLHVEDISSARDDGISPVEGLAMAQDEFERILAEHTVRSELVDLRRGWRLTELEARADGVRVRLQTESGESGTVEARYLVAADGAHSTVRDLLGIEMDGTDDLGRRRTIGFRADLSRWTGDRPRGLYLLTVPSAVLLWTHRDHRWVMMTDDDESAPLDVVRSGVGDDDVPIELLGVADWLARAQWSRTQSSATVFLVGDAAHRVPPSGATGISTALADVHNLAWKLALVLSGRSSPALLDSYQPERGWIARRNAGEAEAMWLASTEQRASAGPRRDMRQLDMGFQYRSPIVLDDGGPDRDPPGMVYLPSAAPGCRAPHIWLDDARTRSTIDLFDTSFALLHGGDDNAPWSVAVDAARGTGVPLTVERIDRPEWAAAYEVSGAGAVLVRPDGHVAWRSADGPADAGELRAAVVAAGRAAQR